jgi:hypothetical protein
MIKDIISSLELTRFDRSHFLSDGAFSLKIVTITIHLCPYNRPFNVLTD